MLVNSRRNCQIYIKLIPLILIALGGAACPKPCHAESNLSYIFEANGKTKWVLWSASDNSMHANVELPNVPSSAFFDKERRDAYFIISDAVYRVGPIARFKVAEKFAALPKNFGQIRVAWRDKTSDRLRIIAMQRVLKGQVTREGGKTVYHLPDGGKIAALADPTWGTPYLCRVLELQPNDGSWKLIGVRATKDEAGETPGDSVVDNLRHEAGISTERLLESYTCRNEQCRNDVPQSLVALASHKAKRKLTDDDLSIWRVREGLRSILFATVSGDQLHVTTPILVVGTQATAQVFEVPVAPKEQYGLGVEGDYLLIATEQGGAHPMVIDLRSGHLLLSEKKGKLATWTPDGF